MKKRIQILFLILLLILSVFSCGAKTDEQKIKKNEKEIVKIQKKLEKTGSLSKKEIKKIWKLQSEINDINNKKKERSNFRKKRSK